MIMISFGALRSQGGDKSSCPYLGPGHHSLAGDCRTCNQRARYEDSRLPPQHTIPVPVAVFADSFVKKPGQAGNYRGS
jgi:hypothetical protein